VKYSYPIDATGSNKLEKLSGNYFFKDDFNKAKLNDRYIFLRTKRTDWLQLDLKKTSGAKLNIDLQPETVSGTANPSFVGFRQPHLKGYAATCLKFEPKSNNEQAGLIIFQNESHYYYMCKTLVDGKPFVQLLKGVGNDKTNDAPVLLSKQPLEKLSGDLWLKIEADNVHYNFYFSEKPNKWSELETGVNAKFLSTKEAKGFVGSVYGMYATSNGQPATGNKASYYWFECKSNDDVYK
jgi:xylan 1,4-beta-xylosidase